MNNKRENSYRTGNTYKFKMKDGIIQEIDISKEFKKKTPSIDELLDEYNDNMTLYRMFGDLIYLEKAQQVLWALKAIG